MRAATPARNHCPFSSGVAIARRTVAICRHGSAYETPLRSPRLRDDGVRTR